MICEEEKFSYLIEEQYHIHTEHYPIVLPQGVIFQTVSIYLV